MARIKEKVGDLHTGTWQEAQKRLNQILRGWCAYFSYGTRPGAYRAVDNYLLLYESVRHFLRRRHQVQSRGANPFSVAVFGELGTATQSSQGGASFVTLR